MSDLAAPMPPFSVITNGILLKKSKGRIHMERPFSLRLLASYFKIINIPDFDRQPFVQQTLAGHLLFEKSFATMESVSVYGWV